MLPSGRSAPGSGRDLTARIHARVGIATGSVVVGDFADEGADLAPVLLGEASRFASLLQSIAEPDAVLIAASTRDLVRGLFEYRAVRRSRPRSLPNRSGSGGSLARATTRSALKRFTDPL